MNTTFNGTPLMNLFDKLPKINEVVDRENIKIFRECGISYSNGLRHTCVLCGKKVSIDGCVSCKGHKLICVQCIYRYFEGDYIAVFEWNKE